MAQPMTYLWTPPPVASVTVQGRRERFPVDRLFFVGRNYKAHAAEMGRPVDKSMDRPFYFTKSHHALVASGSTVPYPGETRNYHHEMELVVALGAGGYRVAESEAHRLVWGYACGLDMTRRDLQFVARDAGKPWDLGKDVEGSAVISDIVPMPTTILERGEIVLAVNGQERQRSDLGMLIWNVREIIADLSRFYHLRAGDLIYTGTPEGVGPVVPGDRISGRIEGVGTIALTIGEPE